MGNKYLRNCCRICLESGASMSIFESKNIAFQIYLVVKEKIDDVEGLPRNICNTCYLSLKTACDFINRYNDTNHVLKNNLPIIKEEFVDYNSDHHSDFGDNELVITYVKPELEESNKNAINTNNITELMKPLQSQIKNKELIVKKLDTTCAASNENKEKPMTKKINAKRKIPSSAVNGESSRSKENVAKKKFVKKLKTVIPRKKKINKPNTSEPELKQDTNDKSPRILCERCGEIFDSAPQLLRHKESVHIKIELPCTICGAKFYTRTYLQRHMNRLHLLEKKFKCPQCDKRFTYTGDLRSHQRNVHNKHLRPKRVFKCKICDKAYKCPKSVIVHERSVHTGLRPAECKECGRTFTHLDYLKEHMRLHTGETPFKCPICGRGCTQLGNMKSHLRVHRKSEVDATILSKMRPNYVKLLKD